MKTHAIIPIFIPHEGCPHDCVFCNQNAITARDSAPSIENVQKTIDQWLTTITVNKNIKTREIAFYGGSFTGIPIEMQSAYLSVAKEYKDAGIVNKLHLSTRPDYIDEKILDNLKTHGVDIIELGVQSFDNEVLHLSNRGHTSEIVYKSAELVKSYGFELGIQLMIGLPGDRREKCIYSAHETVKTAPSLARLYPTVVIRDTGLYAMYMRGSYKPISNEEAVETTKEMYKILTAAGITIMRVGLKSTDLINLSVPSQAESITGKSYSGQLSSGTSIPVIHKSSSPKLNPESSNPEESSPESSNPEESSPEASNPVIDKSNLQNPNSQNPNPQKSNPEESSSDTSPISMAVSGYHPAFRQLVEAAIAREDMESALSKLLTGNTKTDTITSVTFSCHPTSFSNMIGNSRSNRIYFEQKYSRIRFKFTIDPEIKRGTYKCILN